MKKQQILVIALLALVSLMIIPVMAETLTGDLGESGILSVSTTLSHAAVHSATSFTELQFNTIQSSQGLYAVYSWRTSGVYTFDAGAPNGAQTTTSIRKTSLSGVEIGTGTIGYQRLFNQAGTEIGGYTFLLINSPYLNITGLTGDVVLYMNYTRSGLYNISCDTSGIGPAMPAGGATFSATGSPSSVDELIMNNYYIDFWGSYTATKPAGMGISGTIHKHQNGSAILYNGRAYLFDSLGNTLTNDNTYNQVDFNFTTNASAIKIGLQSGLGVWYNSSILFAAAVPTITPTPAPTIPPGYVRNNLYIWDQNDAQIIGADVDVLDVEAGTWTNTTADADGWITIDTLPYHTVNVYAHYPTSNIYLPNEILGLETGYYGGHNWVLVLYPYVTTPSGFVTLYINTRNYDTKAVLTGVGLQIKNLVTGATTGESTGSTDSVTTVVVNATNYQIIGSKSGYLSKTININSGNLASKTVVIELSKATVTTVPTSTIPPGGITPAITVDPRPDVKKATDAFSKWMNILGDVTDIAIGVVIIWLMWITVYMITGGKIIDKIMKRGRR